MPSLPTVTVEHGQTAHVENLDVASRYLGQNVGEYDLLICQAATANEAAGLSWQRIRELAFFEWTHSADSRLFVRSHGPQGALAIRGA